MQPSCALPGSPAHCPSAHRLSVNPLGLLAAPPAPQRCLRAAPPSPGPHRPPRPCQPISSHGQCHLHALAAAGHHPGLPQRQRRLHAGPTGELHRHPLARQLHQRTLSRWRQLHQPGACSWQLHQPAGACGRQLYRRTDADRRQLFGRAGRAPSQPGPPDWCARLAAHLAHPRAGQHPRAIPQRRRRHRHAAHGSGPGRAAAPHAHLLPPVGHRRRRLLWLAVPAAAGRGDAGCGAAGASEPHEGCAHRLDAPAHGVSAAVGGRLGAGPLYRTLRRGEAGLLAAGSVLLCAAAVLGYVTRATKPGPPAWCQPPPPCQPTAPVNQPPPPLPPPAPPTLLQRDAARAAAHPAPAAICVLRPLHGRLAGLPGHAGAVEAVPEMRWGCI